MGDADRSDFAPPPPGVVTAMGRTGLSTPTKFRGFDQGSSRYVTWTRNTLTPLMSETAPNYTGTLIDAHVEIP